jgi:hypothetical protein
MMTEEYVPILFPRWDTGEPVEVRYPKIKSNMSKDDALKMAIEFMQREHEFGIITDGTRKNVINACKKALEQPTVAELNNEYLRDTNVIGLEQPAQKPIFWMHEVEEAPFEGHQVSVSPEQCEYYTIPIYTHPAPTQEPVGVVSWHEGTVMGSIFPSSNMPKDGDLIYTHPHQWQVLTDDEIKNISYEVISQKKNVSAVEFARAIEQALKEKNHV